MRPWNPPGGFGPGTIPYQRMGSKRLALGGVQRRGLWSGFGVKPRAHLLHKIAPHAAAV